jgi:cation diffusion facilitator CzcD-associated flavoprotein CzcO
MADPAAPDVGFDPDILRRRYAEERDKRLRPEGKDQYLEVTGTYASFADDRLARPPDRPVVDRDVDALVVGAGFGGLLAGARLREAGVGDVVLVDKGGRIGGTWYWNQYPGAQCDIESYIYLPLLEELGVVPTERYARAPEILAHAERIADHFGLAEQALLGTEVTAMDWNDDDGRWTVRTDRGDRLRARYVITATGPLHRPKLPGVPGIGEFAGPSFHTSRWDYAVTGGGPEGGLDRLEGVRVAVIGTGATAVQIVPHLAGAAGHLFVFQRTPSSVDVRGNRPTDPAWAASLEPGWQKARVRNFNALVSGVPQDVDLVDDGWTTLIGRMMEIYRSGRSGALDRPFEEVLELANFEKMEEIRARVDALVDDPVTAEALKPYYKMFCKRPCFHDEYLGAFNRDDVTLVDTDGQGVERITADGVVAGGVHYGVDCIIYATGFEVGTGYERRAGFAVHGRDGRTLTEKWDDGGMRTLHGMLTHGYPNLFLVGQSQGAWTANYTQLLDEASRHLAGVIGHMEAQGLATVEATAAAEDAWADQIVAHAVNGTGGIGGTDCTPGYYNNEGRPLDGPPWGASDGRGSIAFFRATKAWRQSGTFDGVAFTGRGPDA